MDQGFGFGSKDLESSLQDPTTTRKDRAPYVEDPGLKDRTVIDKRLALLQAWVLLSKVLALIIIVLGLCFAVCDVKDSQLPSYFFW